MQIDSYAYLYTRKKIRRNVGLDYSLPALQANFFNLMNLGLVSHFGVML